MAGDRPLLLGGVSAAGVGAVLVVVGLALTAGSRDGEDVPAPIGIADQVAFLAQDLQQDTALFLFDRRFRFLTSTDLSQYGAVTPWQWAPLSSQGYSVPMDPLNVRFLAGISFSGTVSYVSDVPDNPVAAATDTQGSTYVLTRVGLAGPGPAYKFDSTGTLVGTFLAPVQLWQGGYAWDVEVDSQGDVILAGTDVAISRGRIAKLDSNGNILWDIVPSPPGSGSTGVISSIALDRQDNIWAIHRGFGSPGGTHLSLFDGQDGQILLDHPLSSGGLALSGALSLDRWGRLYTIGGGGSSIHQFDPLTGNLLQTFTIPGYGVPGSFTGIPFDPRGEEIWTVTVLSVSPVRMALVKVAVATGQTSLLNLSSVWLGGPADMPQTDPMGFCGRTSWIPPETPTGTARAIVRRSTGAATPTMQAPVLGDRQSMSCSTRQTS